VSITRHGREHASDGRTQQWQKQANHTQASICACIDTHTFPKALSQTCKEKHITNSSTGPTKSVSQVNLWSGPSAVDQICCQQHNPVLVFLPVPLAKISPVGTPSGVSSHML
jgi:hypothetical protein